MKKNKTNILSYLSEHYLLSAFIVKWLSISLIIGIFVGSASALFLYSLELVTGIRENNSWIIAFLPLAGLLIGYSYYRWGKEVEKGNNLLVDEYHAPKKRIPFKMAPFVFFGTVLTHLFGGSAGREGTAVQMGGAIADQFQPVFSLSDSDRRILIIAGISGGFASVFGTPLAGAIFALEVLIIGRMRYEAFLPSLMTAFLANFVCDLWGTEHAHYYIPKVPDMTMQTFGWSAVAGTIFGLTALLFASTTKLWKTSFAKWIPYPPFRPVLGGLIIASIVLLSGSTRYIGLGLPTISDAFMSGMNNYDFILKLLFTTFTIAAGFKGGEVTPLFFIGATLGNILIWFIPLPFPLLAGMGFVAVFAGATNTPIACTIMGIELFGGESALYIAIACAFSYFFSGHSGIYSSQIIGSPKHEKLLHFKSKRISEIDQ